jgi:hypothetical protein
VLGFAIKKRLDVVKRQAFFIGKIVINLGSFSRFYLLGMRNK